MDPILISVVVCFGIMALVIGLGFVLRDMGPTSTEDRLEVLTGQRKADDGGSITKAEMVSEGLDGVRGMVSRIMEKFGNLPLLFEQADAPIKADAFFGLTIGVGILGLALGIILRLPTPLLPVMVLFCGLMPLMWLLLRRKRRFKKFAFQLPDALALVGRALRSGHSLSSGLHVVVEEMPAPISEEFGKAYEEQNLGVPIETALKHMLKRMPNMDLKFFVTAVAIQRQAGGDLAEILDKISHIIRERFKIMGQVQALTGEGRISGIVLMALPIGLFVAVYALNPDYIMLLFTEERGRKMIAFAAVMQVLGAICIKKIVNIKI